MIGITIVLYMICSSMPLTETHHVRPKRIAFGEPLPSLDTYKTYYFVQVRNSWACIADQTRHEALLSRCQENYHVCGGVLIHPEFVLTAAHCLMYYEVNLRIKAEDGETYVWIKDPRSAIVDAWEKFEHWISGKVVIPKPKHTVYSDWALVVGSNDYYKMTQKRHVAKVFPHSKFPKNLKTKFLKKNYREELNTYHDVSLLRACLPFKIVQGKVELAPMLSTQEELREQYERIVNTGMLCLYIGFGLQYNNRTEARLLKWPYYKKNLMLHTWRTSKCYSDCHAWKLKIGSDPHSCILCSWHHGPTLGVTQKGDAGGPVICEGNFVATVTSSGIDLSNNLTAVLSYPVHCVKQSITEARLEYYKTVDYNSSYHPLKNAKFRRFLLNPE